MMAIRINFGRPFACAFFFLTCLTKWVIYQPQNIVFHFYLLRESKTRCPTVTLLAVGLFFLISGLAKISHFSQSKDLSTLEMKICFLLIELFGRQFNPHNDGHQVTGGHFYWSGFLGRGKVYRSEQSESAWCDLSDILVLTERTK